MSITSLPMLEKDFWAKVKRALDLPGMHVNRIENTAGTGISDVNACYRGVEVWIELKIVHSNRVFFRTSQRAWMHKRLEAGGRVFVLVGTLDEMALYSAKDILETQHRVEKDGKAFSISVVDLPKALFACNKPFKWEGLVNAIFVI